MSFDPDDPIRSVFAPVLGKPCWNVRPGYAGAFMLEFGEPRLEIREPLVATSESEKVRRSLARRHVRILGDWSLLVEFCRWRVLQNDVSIATSDADPVDVKAVIEALDGQRLVAVCADGRAGTSRFDFDLGGTIETSLFEDDLPGDWTFFTAHEMTLSFRGDGLYSWGPSSRTPDEHVWVLLPGEN